MRRYSLVSSALIVAIGVGMVLGGPVVDNQSSPESLVEKGLQLPAFATKTKEVTLTGSDRAAVICVGGGETYLGLYVYDPHGNCVAWDDLTTPATSDDLAVVFYPAVKSTHTVEVVNFGKSTNKMDGLAIK